MKTTKNKTVNLLENIPVPFFSPGNINPKEIRLIKIFLKTVLKFSKGTVFFCSYSDRWLIEKAHLKLKLFLIQKLYSLNFLFEIYTIFKKIKRLMDCICDFFNLRTSQISVYNFLII